MADGTDREELLSIYRINAEAISGAFSQVNAFLKYLFVLGGSIFAAFLLNYSELIDPVGSLFVVLLVCGAFGGVSLVIGMHILGVLNGQLMNLRIELRLDLGEYGNEYTGLAVPNMCRRDSVLYKASDLVIGTRIHSFWTFAVVVVGLANALVLSIVIPLSVYLLFGVSYLVIFAMALPVFAVALSVYAIVMRYDFKTFIYPLHRGVLDALERRDSEFFKVRNT